jgi:hypothetical protein
MGDDRLSYLLNSFIRTLSLLTPSISVIVVITCTPMVSAIHSPVLPKIETKGAMQRS